MKNRGMGHLEAVISIVMFLIAVFVIILIFSPSRNNNISDPVSEKLYNNIFENASVDFLTFTIKLNNTDSQIEKKANFSIEVNLSESLIGKNISVSDENANMLNYSVNDYDSGAICVNVSSLGQLIFINAAENISNSHVLNYACPGVEEKYYEIVSRNSKKVFSEEKLLKMNNSYYTDYLTLKSQLDIADDVDFSMKVDYANQEINCKKENNRGVEALALNTRKEILLMNGKVEFANINIKIW
jgi:hypothetical protein